MMVTFYMLSLNDDEKLNVTLPGCKCDIVEYAKKL